MSGASSCPPNLGQKAAFPNMSEPPFTLTYSLTGTPKTASPFNLQHHLTASNIVSIKHFFFDVLEAVNALSSVNDLRTEMDEMARGKVTSIS
ncbi:hypothetical protein HK102_007176 [Quaeritorhiza haematococci]|nr:hypothetical protein HK102_007176 [Quaeritorhiza haematococci]